MKIETLGLGGRQESKAPLSIAEVKAVIDALKEKDPMYARIAADAIKILNQKDITLEIKRGALALMQTTRFHAKIKKFWEDATLRGIRNPDHQKQEDDWATGVAETAESELLTLLTQKSL